MTDNKAKELVSKYRSVLASQFMIRTQLDSYAKQCALIAVEEILKAVPMYTGNLNPTWEFYNEVKTEINKL